MKLLSNSIKLLLVLVLLVAAANVASAEFNISEVIVRVDGDKNSITYDGDSVSDEARPESKIKVDVTVENTFEDIEVKDIEITVTIENIDDEGEDDLEEEAVEFDLNPTKDKSKSVSFDIPLLVDAGDYDMVINVKAKDENKTTYDITWTITLTVEKANHELRLYTTLDNEEYKCGGDGRLDVEVLNLGEDEEDEVVLTVNNDALNIDEKREDIILSYDLFDEDSSYILTVPFTVPEDLEERAYSVIVKAYYNTNKLSASKTLDVVVKCPEPTTTTVLPATTTTLEEEEEEQPDEGVGIGEEGTQQPYEPTGVEDITGQIVVEPKGGASATTILIIILIVLVLITLGVLLMVIALKK